jgi:hypothetical protein
MIVALGIADEFELELVALLAENARAAEFDDAVGPRRQRGLMARNTLPSGMYQVALGPDVSDSFRHLNLR